MSLADEIERLAALHERGVLSADEFAQAKARLIQAGPSGQMSTSAPLGGDLPVNRLRRIKDDRWLGGVCGGLSRMTDVESWVWRLAFALLFLFWGSGLLLYILLWVFVPEE
ncbi:MAG TPA: PspC domain-containing protein [Aquabacterium sp.]|uniref:PspC domain-containing protein n=1 Tax=Aquabacterium sp. TaxID=1872578 RepID=UPI002E33EF2C|nr:PspC domain-containing protein [Aquabacterium sp.]HEX5374381.1 PspC domain-containing protein [Aquabacterium sp.]